MAALFPGLASLALFTWAVLYTGTDPAARTELLLAAMLMALWVLIVVVATPRD